MGKNQSHFLNEVFFNLWGIELNIGAFLIFAYLFTFQKEKNLLKIHVTLQDNNPLSVSQILSELCRVRYGICF